MNELSQIQQQIEHLRRQARAAKRREARAALLAAGADTRDQKPGLRTRIDSRTGMPGLTYTDHESGRIWIVDPPIIDHVPLGERTNFTHTDDCADDLCALNGDYHSCVGRVMRCGCMPNAN